MTCSGPLPEAVKTLNLRLVRQILESNPTQTSVNDLNEAFLLCARSPGWIIGQEMAFLLVQHGADPQYVGPDGLNALDWSLINDNLDLAELLSDLGAQPTRPQTKRLFDERILSSHQPPRLPSSLVNACRVRIRQILIHQSRSSTTTTAAQSLQSSIDSLTLPGPMKRYLMLQCL